MSYEVQNFQEDVVNASRKRPVLVDFWAAWCGPCRILGPVLEKLAAEQSSDWTLVKVDTDQNPELSMKYGIRGIPAVKLFVDGEVADEFTGALPEHAVRKWLENAIPNESTKRITEAERLIAEGNEQEAASVLEVVLREDASNAAASGLLAQLIVFEDLERARVLADNAVADPRFLNISSAILRLAEARSFVERASDLSGEPGAGAYLDASRQLGEGDLEGAIQSLIEVLKVNRYLDDDGARKTGVALFSLLGDTHPLSRKYRRTFDMWLY